MVGIDGNAHGLAGYAEKNAECSGSQYDPAVIKRTFLYIERDMSGNEMVFSLIFDRDLQIIKLGHQRINITEKKIQGNAI
jgi:hypothetical protein